MPKKEDILISLCAHLNTNEEREARIKNVLKGDLNWNYFLEKVKKERVGPLVYKTISGIGEAEWIIPKDIFGSLKDIYYSTLRENIIVFKDLEKLLAGFYDRGIKIIVFKGPALAEPVYKDIGLRPMRDVDILAGEEDIQRLDELFRNAGYIRPSYIIKDYPEISANPYRNSIMYKKPDGGVKFIHLFWHIINLFPYNMEVFRRIRMDKIWKEAQPLRLANAQTFTFSVCHQIIYLCMHAFTHSFANLILLCDINEILWIHKDIDWQALVNEAVRFGMSKYLYYGLYVCKEILGSEVPDFILERIRPRKMSLFERRFIEAVLERESISHSDTLACLGMNESLFGRMRYLKGFLFPPKDVLPLIGQKNLGGPSIFDYLKRIRQGLGTFLRLLKNI